MYEEILEKVENIKDFESLCDKELLENIYSLNPIEKTLLREKCVDIAEALGKKKAFNMMLKDIDKMVASGTLGEDINNVCDIADLNVPLPFNFEGIDKINTGEFVVRLDGIYDMKNNLVCGTAIIPYRFYRKNDSNPEQIKILYHSPDGWQELDIARLTVSNRSKIIDLSNHGLSINSANADLMVKYFTRLFDKNSDIIPIRDSVGKLGWTKDFKDFIPYMSVGYDFVASVSANATEGGKQIYDCCKNIKGSKEEWLEGMKKLRDNIPARLIFGASAISPLLEILDLPCFVTMLYGTTGTGKTLACKSAISMWGDPEKLMTRSDSTLTSIARKCLFYNNLPMFVDEFQLFRQTEIQTFLMSVTEGSQRSRATLDSSNNFTSSDTWRNCTIINGEKQCTTDDSIGGGAKNRIIEIRVDDNILPTDEDFADLVECFKNNYGVIAEDLIELYKDKEAHDKLYKRLRDIQSEWRKELNTLSKQLIAISCIKLGDDILRLLYFKEDRELSVDDVKDFVASSDDISMGERAYNVLRDLIISNRNKFEYEDNINQSLKGNSEIWGCISKQNRNEYFLLPSIIKNQLSQRGITLDNGILEHWKHKGYLKCKENPEKGNQYTLKERIHDKVVRCYVIELGDEEDA